MTLICSCFQGKEAEEWGTISRQSSKPSYNMSCLWNVNVQLVTIKVDLQTSCCCVSVTIKHLHKALHHMVWEVSAWKKANHSKTQENEILLNMYPSFKLYTITLWFLNLLSSFSYLPGIHHYNNYYVFLLKYLNFHAGNYLSISDTNYMMLVLLTRSLKTIAIRVIAL